ncbi:MAG: hypothetical protein ACI4JK_02145 [Oscillospiraceae bacterium]
MTDNEIIKALEHCSNQKYISDCEKCQYFAFDCRDTLIEQALDLINRQKAEIEKSRAEAVREFAERLKNTMSNMEANSQNNAYKTAMEDMLSYYVPKIIDKLVKEMECENG